MLALLVQKLTLRLLVCRRKAVRSLLCATSHAHELLRADEPTNHLDLEACVWLEETLKSYPSILLMVSHSQDFLNGVCNNIIYMGQKKLIYYSGMFWEASLSFVHP